MDTGAGDVPLSTNIGAIQQYFTMPSSPVFTSFILTPAVIDPTFGAIPIGANGYASNADLPDPLIAFNMSDNYFISYIGINDGQTAITGKAIALSYNGFPFSRQSIGRAIHLLEL